MPASPTRKNAAARAAAKTTAKAKATGRPRRRDDEVLAAATAIFHEQGYDGASIEDIARRLGILKGSLYYYISSKEDLLFRIVSEVHAESQAILDGSFDEPGLGALERIALYVRRQAIFNVRNVNRISVYYREVDRLSEDRRQEMRRQRRAQHAKVTELLEQGQRAGEVDPAINPLLASHCVFATLVWLYTWYKRGGAIGEEQVADCCVAFVLGGLRATPAGAGVVFARTLL
jgi:AcrR family transcriptional regulator